MKRLRGSLTYANVLATLTLFAVLAGGSAIAANRLARNSVGVKQLKRNAVTTAKLKRNAVTAAKIKKGAVTEAKVKPASLEGGDIAPGMPFGQIVFSARGSGAVSLSPSATLYPLAGASFTLEAGATPFYLGALDISASPGCVEPGASAYLLLDAPNPVPEQQFFSYSVAAGLFESQGANGPLTGRLELSPSAFGPGLGATAAAQTHTLSLYAWGECKSGTGLTATSAGVDVIANRAS
jgi:hypothetical protein